MRRYLDCHNWFAISCATRTFSLVRWALVLLWTLLLFSLHHIYFHFSLYFIPLSADLVHVFMVNIDFVRVCYLSFKSIRLFTLLHQCFVSRFDFNRLFESHTIWEAGTVLANKLFILLTITATGSKWLPANFTVLSHGHHQRHTTIDTRHKITSPTIYHTHRYAVWQSSAGEREICFWIWFFLKKNFK